MTQPLQMVRAEISVRDFQRWMGDDGSCRTRTTGCIACWWSPSAAIWRRSRFD